MRFTFVFLLIVLSAGRPYAVDPHPTTKDPTSSTQQPKMWSPEVERQQRLDYAKACDEVTGLISGGDLRAAEAAVLKWEPEFDDSYGTGDFGFRMRMKIGEAYLQKGNEEEALRLYMQAKPSSDCGLCYDMQEYSRSTSIARIHKSRGEYARAFVNYMNTLPDRIIFGDISRSNVWPAWRCALSSFFEHAPDRGVPFISMVGLCLFTVLMFLPYLLFLGVATILVLRWRKAARSTGSETSGGEHV